MILGTCRALLLALFLCLGPVPASGQWRQDGVPVCTEPAEQVLDAAVPDGAEGAIVAWHDYRGASADIYAQRILPSGKVHPKWPADGLPICTASGEQWDVVMASDGSGGAIIAWRDYRAGDFSGLNDVYAQHVLATGVVDPAWPENGRALSTAPGDQSYPVIVGDGAGGAIVAWFDARTGNSDVYAQHVLASGEVDPAWPRDGLAVCTASWGQVPKSIVGDGVGGAIVAWTDLRNDEDADVYAQHVLASGRADPAWPTDGLAVCSGPAEQAVPVMAGDGAGGAIVVWEDAHRGPDGAYSGTYDLYAQHVVAAGGLDPAWPTFGVGVCTATNDQTSAKVVSDGAGGAFVAWLDRRSQNPDIYPQPRDIFAQHILAAGAADPAWPAGGLPVCTAPSAGGRGVSSIVADGTGGVIIGWSDYRSASIDIYAHHVLRAGVLDPSWPADGQALCTAGGHQFDLRMASDGAGQVVAVWRDYRNGNADVYASRVFTHGAAPPRKPRRAEKLAVRAGPFGQGRNEVLISFDLPARDQVTVEVFDLAGRMVRTLSVHRELEAGTHELAWDGADASGVSLKRGVYLVRVRARSETVTGKFLKLR